MSAAYTEQMPLPDWQTIADVWDDCVRRHGQRIAVVDGECLISYRELDEVCQNIAKALLAANVGRGDRIAIWAPNSWRWVALAHGAWQVGAVVMPISTRLKALEVAELLERTEPKLLFTVSECAGNQLVDVLLDHYSSAGNTAECLQSIVLLEEAELPGKALALSDFLQGAECSDQLLLERRQQLQADDLSELLFTSGTTGKPKGAQLDHRQLIDSYWHWSGVGGIEDGDSYMVIPPFSHGFGINGGILAGAIRGLTLVLMDIFNPAKALALIEAYKVAVIGGPPNLFASLLDHPDRKKRCIDSLRVAFLGAAVVPEDIILRSRKELGIDRVINAYGLIEGCVVAMTRADDEDRVISTTVGRALPGVALRLVDDQGNDLDRGGQGEVYVNSLGVTRGYWQDPEQTASAISDGWLATGDIGVLDEQGYLSIVDRKKDMFICGGFNAYPAEIERLLGSHFAEISVLSVVAIPDAGKGEICVAFAILAEGKTLVEEQIIEWAREHMANYKVPKKVFFKNQLPLNSSGKVMKDELREEALNSL